MDFHGIARHVTGDLTGVFTNTDGTGTKVVLISEAELERRLVHEEDKWPKDDFVKFARAAGEIQTVRAMCEEDTLQEIIDPHNFVLDDGTRIGDTLEGKVLACNSEPQPQHFIDNVLKMPWGH